MPHAKDIKPCPCCDGILGLMPVEITTQRMFVDVKAANEYVGLTKYFQGSTQLTDAMCPDTELVKKMPEHEPTKVLVCMECFCDKLGMLPVLEQGANGC